MFYVLLIIMLRRLFNFHYFAGFILCFSVSALRLCTCLLFFHSLLIAIRVSRQLTNQFPSTIHIHDCLFNNPLSKSPLSIVQRQVISVYHSVHSSLRSTLNCAVNPLATKMYPGRPVIMLVTN